MLTLSHLIWIPVGLIFSFTVPFIFGDLLTLPVDLYYLLYISAVLAFFIVYVIRTQLDIKAWVSARLVWAIILGAAVGFLMMRNVLSRPATAQLEGVMLWWTIFWRGICYGVADGVLLFAFPWLVTWRSFRAPEKKIGGKIACAVVAWAFILTITTTYHLGYADFRSRKIIQPNIGSTIASIPTLITANPAASVISHVFLHVTAVVHSPYTELFLPPHRDE